MTVKTSAEGALTRTFAIARKELIQLRRDRLTLGMMLMLPIFQLLLFGYAINTDIRDIPLVVYDQDGTAMSRDVGRSLEASGFFRLLGAVRGYPEIDAALLGGVARAALVVPPRYASDLARGKPVALQLIVDGSDPQVVASATSTASGFVAARSAAVRAARLPRPASAEPIGLETSIRYNPDQRTAVYIVPGLIGVILTMTMVMLTAMALARERERGTLEQLIVSPIRRGELVAGKILPYIGIGYIQMTFVLLLGWIAFGVSVTGSLSLLFVLAFLFIAANLAIGLFFSTVAKTQQQAMQMSFFFLLPNILLSGFMFPFEAMPRPAQALSQVLPLTHFLRIVRGIVLKGSTFADLRAELVWLVCILGVLVTMSSLRFRKKLG